jgi:hypothetical protein
MRLYYLTAESWAKKILTERRFKLSTFDELNDPFELLGASVGEKRARKIFGMLQAHWTKTVGILCTGASWDNPVMWAHYGDKHRGVCLGFDIDDSAEPAQITYSPHRLAGLLDGLGDGQLMTEEQLKAVLTTKFEDWKYEREWRVFASLDLREPADGKYYLNFSPNIELREIIVGYRCDTPLNEFAELVTDLPSPVKVFQARPAFNTFKMTEQLSKPAITIDRRSA